MAPERLASRTHSDRSSPSHAMHPAARAADRRSGSLAVPALTTTSVPIPRRFSLRSIKRRAKSKAHDDENTASLPSLAPATTPAQLISDAPRTSPPSDVPQTPPIVHTLPKRASARNSMRRKGVDDVVADQLTNTTHTVPASIPAPVISATVPTAPKPRRMMFFREEGVMLTRRDRLLHAPAYVDPLALIKKMPVLVEGWLYIAVHAAPGIAQGQITKWIFRRSVVKRFAQVRGNIVLLYLNRSDPVREVFSPVGCAVSSADTVVNRKGAVEHNVNIAKNGFTIQLRLASEADADNWAACLREISLVRQPRLSDFQVIAPIGEGASGKVFLVRDSKTGRKLALKCMSKKGGSFGYSASEFRHAVDERLAHEQMNYSDFIVRLRHAFQTNDKLYLATEFCEGGDVYNFVDVQGGGVTEDQARIITAQVLLGLKALHDEGIVFRDLKPENVLLDRNGLVRLADFGLCKVLDPCYALTSTVCGTFSYAAAEILEESGYGLSCDLWALGTFLYHIMIGRPPRVAGSLQEARDNVFNSKEPIIWYSDVMSEQAMALVTALIEIDPGRRLGCGPQGIAEVCAHPFFKDLDWMALSQGHVPPYVTSELPPPELGDLRNFNQEEWKSIRMDPDQDSPTYTESVLWPPRNLVTHPLPSDFLVSYSYSCETAGEGLLLPYTRKVHP